MSGASTVRETIATIKMFHKLNELIVISYWTEEDVLDEVENCGYTGSWQPEDTTVVMHAMQKHMDNYNTLDRDYIDDFVDNRAADMKYQPDKDEDDFSDTPSDDFNQEEDE